MHTLLHLLSVVNKLVTLVSEKIYIVFYHPDKYSFWMDQICSSYFQETLLCRFVWPDLGTNSGFQVPINRKVGKK